MKGIVRRKNGYYYFRKTIPADVKAERSARDFLISLGTKSLAEAIIKADPLLKLSSYLVINARRESKKIMFRQTSTKSTDLCLNFMASVVIGDMKMTFEGETQEVVNAIKELKGQPKETSSENKKFEFFDSELILSRKEEYLSYMKRMNYSPQTIRGVKYSFNEFSLILGESRLSDINTKFMRQVIKVIFSLPSEYDNKLDIQTILKAGKPPRNYGTSKNITGRLKSYFAFLVNQNLLDSNPIKSDLYPRPPRTFDSNNYANFTTSDLQKIFSEELIQSSKFLSFYYWTCVLALYTGARVAEILQLRLNDIIFDVNIPYFNIDNSEDKLIKNKSSIRKIPIHPKILELGFKEFCEQVKSEGYSILFPENTSLYHKRPSNNISVWFGKYLDKLKITSDNSRRKVFHSFRHTFITEMQRLDVPLEVRQSIVGHTSGVITIDVYGEKTQLEKMYDWMKKIEFDITIPIMKNTSFHKRKRKEVFSKYSK